MCYDDSLLVLGGGGALNHVLCHGVCVCARHNPCHTTCHARETMDHQMQYAFQRATLHTCACAVAMLHNMQYAFQTHPIETTHQHVGSLAPLMIKPVSDKSYRKSKRQRTALHLSCLPHWGRLGRHRKSCLLSTRVTHHRNMSQRPHKLPTRQYDRPDIWKTMPG